MFNSSALNCIIADTRIVLRREGFIFLWKPYAVGIRTLFTLQTHLGHLSYDFFKLQTHFCAGVKWDLKNRSRAFKINTTLSILLQVPTPNV